MTETVRLINAAQWAPDGRTVYLFNPGEIVTAGDPRAAGGFIETALRAGWAEPVGRQPRPPANEARRTPARPPDPERERASMTAAPKTASANPRPTRARARPKPKATPTE